MNTISAANLDPLKKRSVYVVCATADSRSVPIDVAGSPANLRPWVRHPRKPRGGTCSRRSGLAGSPAAGARRGGVRPAAGRRRGGLFAGPVGAPLASAGRCCCSPWARRSRCGSPGGAARRCSRRLVGKGYPARSWPRSTCTRTAATRRPGRHRCWASWRSCWCCSPPRPRSTGDQRSRRPVRADSRCNLLRRRGHRLLRLQDRRHRRAGGLEQHLTVGPRPWSARDEDQHQPAACRGRW